MIVNNKIKKPLITMGLATYQGERFVRKCLRSVLNQTYKNTEIIICDDNSNDKTLKICREICKEKKNVKIIKNSVNIGAQKNIVKILNLAKGKFFVWVSQDDFYEKEFLEDLVAIYQKDTESILIGCGVKVFDDFGKKKTYQSITKKVLKKSNIEISKDIITKKVLKGEKIKVYLIMGLIKTDILKEIFIINDKPLLNIERIIISMFPFYGKIGYTNKVLVNKYSNPLPLFKRPDWKHDECMILRKNVKFPTIFNFKIMFFTALKSDSLSLIAKLSIFKVAIYYFFKCQQHFLFINLVKVLRFLMPTEIYKIIRQLYNSRKKKLF